MKSIFVSLLGILFLFSCESVETKKNRFLKKGNVKFAETDYKGSTRFFKEALKLDPNFADAHYNLALVFDEIGEKDQAVYHYNQAINFSSQKIQYYIARAQSFLDQKFYYQALKDAQRANVLDKDNSKTYLLMGISQNYLKKYEEAINSFNNGLALKGNDQKDIVVAELRTNLATVYYELKDFKKAQEQLDFVMISGINEAHVYNVQGMIKLEQQDFQGALKDFDYALKEDYASSYFHNNKGTALFKLGQLDDALEHINLSIQYDPYNEWAYLNKAKIYYTKKNEERALKLIDKALIINGENREVKELLKKIKREDSTL